MALTMYVPITHAKPETHLAGSITLRPRPGTDFDVRTFTISLLGVSKTRIITGNGSSEEIHESTAIFLKIEKEIHRGPMVLESGHVCHFNFAFPEDPASTQPNSVDADLPHIRAKPKAQALPPSGEFGSGNLIAYSFEASLVDENSQSEIKASAMLEFSKTREVEVPDPQITTTVQEQLLASQDSIIGPSSFRLALDSPQIIIQEQSFPLMLRLSHEHSRTTSSPQSAVLLKSCLMQLLANTAIQSENNTQNHWTNKHTIASRDLRSLEPKAGAPSITTKGLDMGLLLRNPSIPLHYAPTFECTNIQRTYGLEVSLTVECGGETFDLKFEVGPVTVLAAEYVGEGRAKEEGNGSVNTARKDPRFGGDFRLVNDDFV